jgi:hypothetical protein
MKERRQKHRIQASSTTNTYVYCWIAARNALKSAQEEREGSFYSRMVAGVFAAFTIEGYLNHLGQRYVSDWAVFERKLGPREKLLFLQRVLRLSVDQSRRPFQTLPEIMQLRDRLAHGKTVTEVSEVVVDDPHSEAARYPEPRWVQLCALPSVARMVEDAEAMVRNLHGQTGSKLDPFDMLGHGSIGMPVAVGEAGPAPIIGGEEVDA